VFEETGKKRETNKLGDGYRTPIKKTTTAWPAPLNKEDSISLKEEEKSNKKEKHHYQTAARDSQRKYTDKSLFGFHFKAFPPFT